MKLSAQRSRGLAFLSEAPAYEIGRSGLLVSVNASFADALGQPAEELVGRPLAEVVLDATGALPDLPNGSDGTAVWTLESNGRAYRFNEMFTESDSVANRLGLGSDVSDLAESVTSLDRSERWFRALIAHARLATIVIEEDKILHITPAAATLLDRSAGDLLGRPVSDIAGLDEALAGGTTQITVADRTVTLNAHDAGEDSAISGTVVVLHSRDSESTSGVDPLTGLPDRSSIGRSISAALARSARAGRFTALLFIDLDRFKLVNDVHGHAAGDRLLVTVARRLSNLTRSGETVARISGDEFVIVLENVGTKREAMLAGERVVSAVTEPVDIGRTEAHVGASVGIAMGENGDTIEELMAQADAAMYQAKQLGRGRVVFFSDEMRQATDRQLQVVQDLRTALENDGLSLNYVPLVDLDSGRVVALEALARWVHPERGLIPPSEFIALAERSGLIISVGEWSIRQACRDLASWNLRSRTARIAMSVNVSNLHFSQPSLLKVLEDSLADNALGPGSLTLEINEAAILSDPDSATRQLGELERLGVRVSIDDFGTGSASLHFLNTFDVAEVKLDRALVEKVPRAGDDLAIVSSIISLADALGFDLVAEGIETMEQRHILLDAGCRIGQGYLFGRPMPPEELASAIVGGVVVPSTVRPQGR